MLRRRMMMEVLSMSIGKDYPNGNISNMFYALENGIAKTGTFSFERAISSETMVFDVDIETIRGICIYDEDISAQNEGNTPENTLLSIGFFENGIYKYGVTKSTANNRVSANFLVRCSHRIDGGSLYVTPNFAGNTNYTPFHPAHNYRYIVW